MGTELLTGKVNTHTAYLGQKLTEVGLLIAREHAVTDDPAIMRETFTESFRRSDVVLCAGGLGPTFDDITRDVWSVVLKRPLKFQPSLIDDIRKKFKSRGLSMPPMNRRQAMVLRGAAVIPNALGTAPGQILSIGKKVLALLPGPARELMPMVERVVLPHLRAAFPGRFIKQQVFQIYGVAESHVDQLIRPWVTRRARVPGFVITHGILASQSVISVKFSVEGRNSVDVERVHASLVAELKKLLGNLVFGEANDTLEAVVGRLLRSKKKTLAVAESCTGGSIAKLMTEAAGASDYFIEGAVTYANQAKMRRLGVKRTTLERYGAVSEQIAREMAVGMRRVAKSDYALSVTGIAGPSGGTDKKPVGLVYIGCVGPRRTFVEKFKFAGERGLIRHRASLTALNILRKELL